MATTWKQSPKLTAKGLALQSKPLAGKPFAFTRAVMSSVYVASEDQEALTALPNHEQDLYLQPVTLNANGTATLWIVLMTDDVKASYPAHTIGIYAEDPDEGEILYATVTDAAGDVIPTFQEAPKFLIDWTINIGYGNASEVIVQRVPDSYVTFEVAQELLAGHNTSPDAHSVALERPLYLIQNNKSHIEMLEAVLFNDITTNPFLFLFDDLNGVTATGVWNAALQRIEC